MNEILVDFFGIEMQMNKEISNFKLKSFSE